MCKYGITCEIALPFDGVFLPAPSGLCPVRVRDGLRNDWAILAACRRLRRVQHSGGAGTLLEFHERVGNLTTAPLVHNVVHGCAGEQGRYVTEGVIPK